MISYRIRVSARIRVSVRIILRDRPMITLSNV